MKEQDQKTLAVLLVVVVVVFVVVLIYSAKNPWTTIVGTYKYISAPLGEDFAGYYAWAVITSDNTRYFVYVDGEPVSFRQSWKGYTPNDGDNILVIGKIYEKEDMRGFPYLVIDVETLQPT